MSVVDLPKSLIKQAVGSYADELNRRRELPVPPLPKMVGALARSENNISEIKNDSDKERKRKRWHSACNIYWNREDINDKYDSNNSVKMEERVDCQTSNQVWESTDSSSIVDSNEVSQNFNVQSKILEGINKTYLTDSKNSIKGDEVNDVEITCVINQKLDVSCPEAENYEVDYPESQINELAKEQNSENCDEKGSMLKRVYNRLSMKIRKTKGKDHEQKQIDSTPDVTNDSYIESITMCSSEREAQSHQYNSTSPTDPKIPPSSSQITSSHLYQLDEALRKFKLTTAKSRENLRDLELPVPEFANTVKNSREFIKKRSLKSAPENKNLDIEWKRLSQGMLSITKSNMENIIDTDPEEIREDIDITQAAKEVSSISNASKV